MDHFKPLSKSANCKSKSKYKVNLIQIPNTLFKFLLPRWFRRVVERVASRWRWWGEAEASARRSTRTSWSWPRPAALAPRPSSRRCRPQCPRSSEASSMLKKFIYKWRHKICYNKSYLLGGEGDSTHDLKVEGSNLIQSLNGNAVITMTISLLALIRHFHIFCRLILSCNTWGIVQRWRHGIVDTFSHPLLTVVTCFLLRP